MFKKILVLIIACATLTACAPPPPHNQLNICAIFREYPSWYWQTSHVQRKWGVPISVQMAILHEESHFHASARPKHRWLLGFIPWFRPTSALGYSQAVNDTWRLYLRDTGQSHARRSSFADAADFIGWYANVAHRKLGISKYNTFELYLAYHQGINGYKYGSYRRNPKLIAIARKVSRVANIYRRQLLSCRSFLRKKSWWRFW